jgi:enterochelin esterase-like enzyme
MSAAAFALANDSLTAWLVALGMDEERGLLLAACFEVTLGAALATAFTGTTVAVRCGAVLAMVAVQVGPFLVRAAQVGPTPGLVAHRDIAGWLLQPLGMILLGAVAATVGTSVGALLRSDGARLWSVLRRHRLSAVPLAAAAGLVVVGGGAAATALQSGPVSALYQYGIGSSAGGAARSSAGGGASTSRGVSASFASIRRPGHIERFDFAGHRVDVYLPGAYTAAPGHHFAVVYFLHGFAGGPDQWSGAGQLVAVLDQLIATSQVAPLIAVMPDGNGHVSAATEWGNTIKGDHVETWLVDQLVPQIDQRYRTLGAHYRGVAGFSSGGYGALNLAARHQGVFGWAASYSGYFSGRTDLFGSQAAANSPNLTLPSLAAVQRMPIFIGAGTKDGHYLTDAQSLGSALQRVGWRQLQTATVPGGHSWEVWRPLAVQSLHWLERLWGPDPGSAGESAAGAAVSVTQPHRGCGACHG